MDEQCSGYYVHGRNQMQFSDTDLHNLNLALLKEEDGLVGNRGLVAGSDSYAAMQNQVPDQLHTILIWEVEGWVWICPSICRFHDEHSKAKNVPFVE
jgi:Meckelin (Transmembrane protein 67)